MAEHVHKTYSCDRCKADLGAERPSHSQEADIVASFNWQDGPGAVFKWKDLCTACRDDVFAFFKPNGRSL